MNPPKSQDMRYKRCYICGMIVDRENGMLAHMRRHKNESKREQTKL